MLNKANVDLVIASIRGEAEHTKKLGVGFNMSDFLADAHEKRHPDRSGNACGTVACIAGHAALLHQPNVGLADIYEANDYNLEPAACIFLGISERQGDDLFYGHDYEGDLSEITPDEAITVLEHLKKTGEVDWSIIGEARS